MALALFLWIIVAGLPIAIQPSGTSIFTKAFGAITTLLPILILPTRTALACITTLSPILGTPAFLPSEYPMVTPCDILKFLPIITLGLTTIWPKCTILNPYSIKISGGI